MTSLVSDALAGFSAAITGDRTQGVDEEMAASPHYKFIHEGLLPMTSKIQRELRGRRFRAVQAKLQEAILLLKNFERERWPPEDMPEEPEWMNVEKTTAGGIADSADPATQNGDEASMVATSTADDEIESTVGDFSVSSESTPDDGLEDAMTPAQILAETETSTASSPVKAAVSMPTNASPAAAAKTDEALFEDDPKTRRPMHLAIMALLEAFCLVMSHPSKTNNVCEFVLDTICELVKREYISGRAGGKDDTSGSGSLYARQTNAVQQQQQQQTQKEGSKGEEVKKPPCSLLHRLLDGVYKCSESVDISVQMKVVRCNKIIMTSPRCGVHEASMLFAIRGTFHIYLVTKSMKCRTAAKSALLSVLETVFGRMEDMEITNPDQTSQFHTDAFVLFRSLCRLASKRLGDEDETPSTLANFAANFPAVNFFTTTTTTDPISLSNKVLSLELLQQVMQCAGNAVCQGERFIHLVQTQLCVTMLKNCMSNHTQVAFMSQRIFLVLVYKFKTHLKKEIEVFMSNIFLRVLDSPNSSLAQKALVLESLRSLCNDPVMLTQIFLNYDCDFQAMNLYKDIVFRLTKLGGKSKSQPDAASNTTTKDALTDFEVSLSSVEVLVTILKAFLKALGLSTEPISLLDEEYANQKNIKSEIDIAGSKIRSLLRIDSLGGTLEISKNSKHPTGTENGNAESAPSNPDSSSNGLTVADLARHTAMTNDASSSDLAGRIVDAFDRKRNQEQNFELGAVKFTLSLKGGLNFFIDNGFVELDAKSLAKFLLENKDKLDKTQTGEVLGKEPDAAFVKPKLDEGVPPQHIDADKGGPGFFVRILYHYTDAMDFAGLEFDDAIRQFLSGFRLPGEAQKIDRIMEKFAERFTRQNPTVFTSADTAFILAFSVIMLNTDLHNPSIKPERRMTVESFLSNNRGIGENGADLDRDFLIGIFNRIRDRPFSLKEDDVAREKEAQSQLDGIFFSSDVLFGASTEEKKKEKFQKEREEMLAATEQLIRRRPAKSRAAANGTGNNDMLTDNVSPADVVKPMFDVTWGPMIGILSQVLEFSNDVRSTSVCLNGFVYAIRIAAHGGMSLARDTFINSLANFTFLGSIKEMKHKNIAAIETLLSIAVQDGEYLEESWGSVLQCISKIARMRMSASGLDADESFLQDNKETTTSSSSATPKKAKTRPVERLADGTLFRQPTKAELSKETEENNGRAILESVNEVWIDRVFSSTVKLSARSLACFISQLVTVSKAEIDGTAGGGAATNKVNNPPTPGAGSSHGDQGTSIFSLQRLVEVADYNMDIRPRLVWKQIWLIVSDFFAAIGCHKNGMVSVFAMDSLKQLSFKFLEKPELSEFHFQRMFLTPFLQVIENPGTRPDIRELVLQCIDNIIRTRSHNLQSGWKIVFSIIKIAANDPIVKINIFGLNIMQRLVDDHLEQLCRVTSTATAATTSAENEEEDAEEEKDENGSVTSSVKEAELSAFEEKNRNTNADDFIFMYSTSLDFIKDNLQSPRPVTTSMRALSHIAIFADLLAEGRVKPPVSGAQCTEPLASGYTYEGLTENEALEMSLWRPLFEGLAQGIRSNQTSAVGGVGCLLHRGSVLVVRSILLRQKDAFSVDQMHAIVKQTIMPAIQFAVRNDDSRVVTITSESPAVSSLDFLVESPPLPPPLGDEGLHEFEMEARQAEGSPKRKFGVVELLVEASFTDMRHGGGGDLSQAYKFLNKTVETNVIDQPFPNSWIATTAPIALGLLADLLTEVAFHHGEKGKELFWPMISSEISKWCNGSSTNNAAAENDHENENDIAGSDAEPWSTCEALVRSACVELRKLFQRLALSVAQMDRDVGIAWANDISGLLVSSLELTLTEQEKIQSDLLRLKLKPYMENDDSSAATESDDSIKESKSADEMGWLGLVPLLKVRSISAHCLQQSLSSLDTPVLQLLKEDTVSKLVKLLHMSRTMAENAVLDEDLNHAFKEDMLSSWGVGMEEVGEEDLVNLARQSTTQGSAMFFLTQSAGGANAIINILTGLYKCAEPSAEASSTTDAADAVQWEREKFAAQNLISIIHDILTKFVESESKEGHTIDPNEWRHAIEGAGKIAIYCTSFAGVVVVILKAMQGLEQIQMERLKTDFFPLICSLIRVQSEDIRDLVQKILLQKFGPLMGIEPQ
eukprot:CAMPEP_0119552528 /NCGR_PEP_ID=MMETSP1352-20130426/5482_1 /TAXON_ID=265584 /ORGANISM="Stauroneis constricta, Strain CCMP1120" /LENGTH=2147 /DNA_ID=CAMNT_0007598771 /DNA_START=318 /DNA_END=6761 /DNA_ORIENTATION=+